MRIRGALAPALAGAVLLAGCASHHRQAATAVPPPARPPSTSPEPTPAAGTSASVAIPAVELATIWRLRVALNVAALVCRGHDADTLVKGYNRMLEKRRVTLAAAHSASLGQYGGSATGAAYDTAMTRLYNFYAQPAATRDFCVAAGRVQGAEADVAETHFPAFATQSLAMLDAPFANIRVATRLAVHKAPAKTPARRRKR